jgi:cytochrome c553
MEIRLLACVAMLVLSGTAMAASGDASVGRKKSTPCAACHGAEGVSPSPEFPNLAGQHADYLETALRHYQNGKRKNPIMQAQVKDLKAKDIADLAAFFSSQHGLKTKY